MQTRARDPLPPRLGGQSWSGRWSLWRGSTEAGHALGHQLFYCARPPQRAFQRSAPLKEKPACIRELGEAALLRMPPKWENSGQVHKSRFLASKSNLPKTIPLLATQGFSYKLGLVHVSFLLWVSERSLSQDPFIES